MILNTCVGCCTFILLFMFCIYLQATERDSVTIAWASVMLASSISYAFRKVSLKDVVQIMCGPSLFALVIWIFFKAAA